MTQLLCAYTDDGCARPATHRITWFNGSTCLACTWHTHWARLFWTWRADAELDTSSTS